MSDSFVTAKCYVVVEADVRPSGDIRDRGKVDRATTRPPHLAGPQAAVYLTLRLPKSVFHAAVAEVTIDVPEADAITPEVSVVTDTVVA